MSSTVQLSFSNAEKLNSQHTFTVDIAAINLIKATVHAIGLLYNFYLIFHLE